VDFSGRELVWARASRSAPSLGGGLSGRDGRAKSKNRWGKCRCRQANRNSAAGNGGVRGISGAVFILQRTGKFVSKHWQAPRAQGQPAKSWIENRSKLGLIIFFRKRRFQLGAAFFVFLDGAKRGPENASGVTAIFILSFRLGGAPGLCILILFFSFARKTPSWRLGAALNPVRGPRV